MTDAIEENPSDNHIVDEEDNGDQMSLSNEVANLIELAHLLNLGSNYRRRLDPKQVVSVEARVGILLFKQRKVARLDATLVPNLYTKDRGRILGVS
jgi:hypothetical protein